MSRYKKGGSEEKSNNKGEDDGDDDQDDRGPGVVTNADISYQLRLRANVRK